MFNEQNLMGIAIATICAWGLLKSNWFLMNTKKGERLILRFGERMALQIIRCLFTLGVVFGVLLSADIVSPIRW